MRRLFTWITRSITGLLLVGCLATTAHAQDFDSLVAEGLKLYSEGEYDGAIEKFFQAKLINDESELIYNIARSYHKKGDCAAAKKNYKLFMQRGDAPAATSQKAGGYIEELGECPSVGTLALACSPPSAQVQVDDQEAVACGSLELDQGDHVLLIVADGYAPQNLNVTVIAGQVGAQAISLEQVAGGGGGGGEEPIDTPSGTNWLAIGLLSGGGALIATTVVIDIINYTANAQELDKMGPNDPSRASFEDSFETNQSIMWVTGGLGVAAAAAGVVFVIMDIGGGSAETAAADDTTAWQLTPTVSPDGSVGAWLSVSF